MEPGTSIHPFSLERHAIVERSDTLPTCPQTQHVKSCVIQAFFQLQPYALHHKFAQACIAFQKIGTGSRCASGPEQSSANESTPSPSSSKRVNPCIRERKCHTVLKTPGAIYVYARTHHTQLHTSSKFKPL
jgi:hypothetical protein